VSEPDLVQLPWWVRTITIAPAVAVVLIAWQRWDQPHRARSITLAGFAAAIIIVDRIVCMMAPRMERVPRFITYLPVDLVVLALIWTPVDSDVAPFLLVLVTVHAAIDAAPFDSVLVMLLSIAVMVFADAAGHFTGSWTWALAIVLSWTGGFTLRWALGLLRDLRDAQADLAERSALDERQRIAREIHDVLAHSLSVATLHITGARRALSRDPHEAAEALEQAERLTRDSLMQVRSVVGMLSPDADGTAAAMPTADDIEALVEEFRRAGADVSLEIEGDVKTLSAPVGLAVYRVTQESLSNAIRHATGQPASVHIVIAGDCVHLDVTNPLGAVAAADSPGRGIVGMNERASALLGTLEVGPEHEHWRVHMTTPIA
jgi:signal transduction histidine kinase